MDRSTAGSAPTASPHSLYARRKARPAPAGHQAAPTLCARCRYQPKIEEINKKYEKDPEKRSAKTMELYKKEKVNPMGGCLPMLIQLPILYAMFAVMRHIAGEAGRAHGPAGDPGPAL